MRTTSMLTATGGAALAAFGGLLLYGMALRPWHLRFGATRDEADRPMAGDELLPVATSISTRAITIDRDPEEVWPWLVQMGRGRGGLYSYERIENAFGLDIHNADRVHPEWQRLAVGDRIELSEERFGLIVRQVEKNRSLVYEFADGGWVWAFQLTRRAPGKTRLVVRNRWSSHFRGPGWRLSFWALEPAAFVMEQRMLRGLRERAETDVPRSTPARPDPRTLEEVPA